MLYKCFVFTGVFVNVIHLLYILSETVGEPTIHDFCEHTYAHQWEFPSTTKIILRKQCKALSEYVKKNNITYPNN